MGTNHRVHTLGSIDHRAARGSAPPASGWADGARHHRSDGAG